MFLWNNFGPMHADRVDAVAKAKPDAEIHGIEILAKAPLYSWKGEARDSFEKHTLFGAEETPGFLRRAWLLLRMRRRIGRGSWFLCHYERPEVWLLALWLRLTGCRVFTMGCSKFDDAPRRAFREWAKTAFLLPYNGAIGSEERSSGYFGFLGFHPAAIAAPYNTLSLQRMRDQAGAASLHEADVAFADRPWVIVARLVDKKNLFMALEAFAVYRRAGGRRRLELLGDGPLDEALRQRCSALGIAEAVDLPGFLQSDEISRRLSKALALVLPSIEEQFGNVVIEAQALSLPVLISDVCGARDKLVRNWKNGFVFEPDNPEGLARFMLLLDGDEALWAELCHGAEETAPLGDVSSFARAVEYFAPDPR